MKKVISVHKERFCFLKHMQNSCLDATWIPKVKKTSDQNSCEHWQKISISCFLKRKKGKYGRFYSTNDALFSTASELPDIHIKNAIKMYQKGHKSLLFSKKMTSGNFEAAFFLVVRRTLIGIKASAAAILARKSSS